MIKEPIPEQPTPQSAEQERLKMNVGKDGIITWNKPRSSNSFTIQLFGTLMEKLYRVEDEAQGGLAEIAEANGENNIVEVKPGTYKVAGGIAGLSSYSNLIEVDITGNVTEKKGGIGR